MCEYGYLNHSSTGQRDSEAITAIFAVLPCENITVEQLWSPGERHRPAFDSLMDKLRPGDTLFVHSIDRLGTGVQDAVKHWHSITRGKKANIVVLDSPKMDTRANPDIPETQIRAAAEKTFAYLKRAMGDRVSS